jgi:DNA modification methylase
LRLKGKEKKIPLPPVTSWPADKVERWPIERLVPYARNARTHTDEQIGQVAASIREWGWTNPVLVGEDGGIIAGHCRVLAATKLGLTEVPVMIAAGWTEAQRRAYVLADNQLALNAGWNPELLRAELGELQGLGFEIGLIGFDAAQLAALSGNPGLTDPDEVPEAPAVPVSRQGDLWLLGHHRLLCGDATNAADVARCLGEAKPHLMVTDPPYGVSYDPDWRNRADRANGKPYGASAVGVVSNDDRADWREAWALFPGDVAYAWHPPGAMQVSHHAALVAAGFEVRMQVIWAKQQFPIGRGNYHVQHEPCWYAVRKGKTAHWQGDRTQSTLWQIDKPQKSETGHSTQKPVECMKRPIENNSAAGDAIYDPFVGSGTTIIAAEMTGRRCCAIEIDPAYVDVAIERWQNFTGEQAVLDGRGFDEIAAERRQEAA